MNKNTENSSPILINAIMKGTTESKRSSACSLVMLALGDRDREINRTLEAYKSIKSEYNDLLLELKNMKLRQKIE